MKHITYIALGSNLGDRAQNLDRAIEALQDGGCTLLSCSSYIETEPEGFSSPHTFLNAAAMFETGLTPQQLLRLTQQVENDLGRTRKSQDGRYQDRPIDLDILLYDDWVISTPTLTLPHPRMHLRRFVLKPLSEIAPDLIIPTLNISVAEQLNNLADAPYREAARK